MKHIKMPKAMAEKWLTALRSEKYTQCRGRLADGVGYCCLGVLQMEISGKIISFPHTELPTSKWLSERGIEFLNKFGGPSQNPYSHVEGRHFSELNDSGRDFKEIADLLEKEIEYNDKD